MNTYFFLQLSDFGFRFHQQCKVLYLCSRFYHSVKMVDVNAINFALDVSEL